MFIGRKKIEVTNSNDDNKENKVIYKCPEILMIDCNGKEVDKLKEKGFNIEIGSFGEKYKIIDQYGKKKVTLNNKIGNIIEKDIVVIDMKQRNTNEIYNLEDLDNLEDGTYITTHERQREFNPINISSKFYIEDFRKLRDKDSIIIIFADREIREKYNITTWKDGYYSNQSQTISNYDFLPLKINIQKEILKLKNLILLQKEYLKIFSKIIKEKYVADVHFTLIIMKIKIQQNC